MAAANPNWARWVKGSVAQHLVTAAQQANLPLIVEGIHTRSDAFKASITKAEVTIAGPNTREISQGNHRIRVGVFIIVSTMQESDRNALNHTDFCGILQNALDQCIVVREHAPGVSSPAEVGILTPGVEPGDEIVIQDIKPGTADPLFHSIIEARFSGEFSE